MAKKKRKQNKRKTRRKANNNTNVRNNAPRSNKGQNTANKPARTAKPVHNSAKDSKTPKTANKDTSLIKKHPRFPFWARLKISKKRTTLVIDEETSLNNKTNKIEEQFVHREATTPTEDEKRNNKYERISPNPDKTKETDMLLKRPSKLPKRLFTKHEKKLDMPKALKDKYDKNNDKDKEK